MTKIVHGMAALAAIGLAAGDGSAQTIRLETEIARPAEEVWDAVRDVFNVDTRLVPGFVTAVSREGDVRRVTFANGFVVTEQVVTIDDDTMRMAYSAFGGRATYHMASMQVIAKGDHARLVWITDFLPAELAPMIAGNMEQGIALMKQTLEADQPR